MLEDYKKIEPIIYKQMIKALYNNLSHAYLFDLNNNVYAENMIMAFVKEILCKRHSSKEEYEKCSKCKRIDDGNYSELKQIYPDGLMIKKEQLDELQKKFSTKALESEKKVYIIHDVDRLNLSAANSLLKFLEEPGEGIIAILLTSNLNQVLNTISSRCQILKFNNSRVEDFIKYNNINTKVSIYKISFSIFLKTNIDEYIESFINNVVDFWKNYESNGKKMIIYEKQYFLDIFKEKEEILNFIKCSILLYRDVINYKLNNKILYYNDYESVLEEISNKNTLDKLLYKLNVILDKEKLVSKNVNINMFIDGLIIDMEE
jgi:DNA polymerase-3 subunit delta'